MSLLCGILHPFLPSLMRPCLDTRAGHQVLVEIVSLSSYMSHPPHCHKNKTPGKVNCSLILHPASSLMSQKKRIGRTKSPTFILHPIHRSIYNQILFLVPLLPLVFFSFSPPTPTFLSGSLLVVRCFGFSLGLHPLRQKLKHQLSTLLLRFLFPEHILHRTDRTQSRE